MRTNQVPIFLASLLLVIVTTLSSCKKDDEKPLTIKVAGIEFSPNCLLKNDRMVGIDADIADTAMKMAGVIPEPGMAASWDEAYNATLAGPNRALLTVGYSAARKDLFKWAGPTSQGMYGIFSMGETGLVYPLSIEACKKIGPIAVVRNWLETTTLEGLGFQNLQYYDTYDAALTAFKNKEITFLASDFFHLVSSVPSGYYVPNIRVVTRYLTVFNYIAFTKDVSDEVVAKVQTAIETLIKDKSTVSIVNQYFKGMPADYIPGTVQLFTEVSPPHSYGTGRDTTRQVTGASVELVNEIQKRVGYVNKINLSTWTDAYTPPQYLPNSAVFTTARTPKRESLFQWVGPLCTFRACFYTLAGSGITIETIAQARALKSVGTPKEWYTNDYLTQNGFTNIVSTAVTSQEAFNQLFNGEVEALLMTADDMEWLAEARGVPLTVVTKHIEALIMDGYIAFSLNTPATLVQQWQTSLNAMKADGSFEIIRKKWFTALCPMK